MGEIVENKGIDNKSVVTRGVTSIIGGGLVFFALGILGAFWPVTLVLGLGLFGGGIIMARNNVNKVLAFLMLVVGFIILIRFIPFVGNFIDLVLYIGAGALVLIGVLTLFNHYNRK